jgi:hypothetical protein
MQNTFLAGGGSNPEITNPLFPESTATQTGLSFFQTFVPHLVGLALAIGTTIFFFILILGAIQWISSGGDKQALEGARSKITNALIGIVIMFSIFAVLSLIQYFFGITIMALDIGSLVI